MRTVVVLVGRPNVGKSTLFNRLTRTEMRWLRISRRVTRDRSMGCVVIEGREFIWY